MDGFTRTEKINIERISRHSVAGVALMGQARGVYTFFAHLKWMPARALGYAASIYVHMAINHALF